MQDSCINNDTGNLNIYGDVVQLRSSGDEYYFKVKNYYNNSKKFETTSEGTVTTGIATATAIDAAISAWVLGANELITIPLLAL